MFDFDLLKYRIWVNYLLIFGIFAKDFCSCGSNVGLLGFWIENCVNFC